MIPPDANAGFVAAMEDVLETYQKPRDPDRPLVCLDETSKQLIVETRTPIPAKPGRPARHDYEYERNGVANLFMMFAPLEGWRNVKVTDRHAAVDYAHVLKELSDVHFPAPNKSSSCKTISAPTRRPRSMRPFPPPKRAASSKRFEWHYTPKHGSWLDMAESELGVLSTQCLSRRIPDKQTLERRSPLGRTIATNITPKPIGNSRQTTPALSSRGYATIVRAHQHSAGAPKKTAARKRSGGRAAG